MERRGPSHSQGIRKSSWRYRDEKQRNSHQVIRDTRSIWGKKLCWNIWEIGSGWPIFLKPLGHSLD